MPKLVVDGVKRSPLNMRTTTELRGKLEMAAAESGRSLIQEVEYRIEQSFDAEIWKRDIRSLLREELAVLDANQGVIPFPNRLHGAFIKEDGDAA